MCPVRRCSEDRMIQISPSPAIPGRPTTCPERYHAVRKLILLLLASLFLSACSFSLAEDVTPPPGYRPPQVEASPTRAPVPVSLPDRAPDLVRGAAIYTESCQPCHGSAGLGDGPQADQLPNPPTALGDPEVARQAVPGEWYQVVTQGRLDRFMPPFTSLSDAERWDVVHYALTLSADQHTMARIGELYQEQCAACHGESGAGDGPDAGSLSVAPTNFLDPAFLAERNGQALFRSITEGVPPAMPGFESALSEEERWALVDHLRALAYDVGEEDPTAAQEDPVAEAPDTEGEEITTGQEERASEAEGDLPVQSGTVTGVVVNGSGGRVPEGLEVTLHGFDHIEEVYTATTMLDAEGAYAFSGVAMPESRIFMVTVDYDEATYNSDLAIAEADSEFINLPVTVFETTTDTSALVVDRLHIFVESAGPGLLQVTELYLISNSGDRVVVPAGQGEPVVRYSLPQGARELRFQPGTQTSRFVETTDGFGDTMGIPPGTGQYQVLYAYDLAYERPYEYEKAHDIPVNSVVVLLPEAVGLRVRSDHLQDAGPRDVQGEAFLVYSGDRLDPSVPLQFSLTGRLRGATAAAVDVTPDSGLMIGLGVFGLTLVVAGVWVYRVAVNRRSAPSSIEQAEVQDPESLLDSIIALDDLYRAGELPEEAYRERRSELKVRLRDSL